MPSSATKKCFRPFFSTELKVFFYDLSFKILSEVYRPELANRQAAEFIKLSKDVSNLVC